MCGNLRPSGRDRTGRSLPSDSVRTLARPPRIVGRSQTDYSPLRFLRLASGSAPLLRDRQDRSQRLRPLRRASLRSALTRSAVPTALRRPSRQPLEPPLLSLRLCLSAFRSDSLRHRPTGLAEAPGVSAPAERQSLRSSYGKADSALSKSPGLTPQALLRDSSRTLARPLGIAGLVCQNCIPPLRFCGLSRPSLSRTVRHAPPGPAQTETLPQNLRSGERRSASVSLRRSLRLLRPSG